MRADGCVIFYPLAQFNTETNTQFVHIWDTALELREAGWLDNNNNTDDKYDDQCLLNS